MAGHELNPNRDVRPGSHTACSSLCGHEDSQSPNLRSSDFSRHVPSLVATPAEQDSRSAPSDQISTIEACGRRSRTEWSITIMRDRAWPSLSRTLLFAFDDSPSPSVTVMIT
jgi:hypothetical protein